MKPMEAVILIIFLVLALLIYLLPLAAGLYMERKDRRRRGEPDPEKARYGERQRLIRLEAGNHALYAVGACLLVWLVLGVCWTAIGAVNLEVPSISLLSVVQLLMGGSWLVMGLLMLCARRRRKLAERGLDAEDGEI